LRAGRDFNANDTPKSASVAIVSEAFARFLYEGANPIGRHIHIGNNDADAEIVGVVRDSRINDVREKPPRVDVRAFRAGWRRVYAAIRLSSCGRQATKLV
jgi:hypothetical protein